MIYSANVQGYVIHSLTPPYHAYILIQFTFMTRSNRSLGEYVRYVC